MKPKRILLVRHGESVGNADPLHYESTPDYQVPLSEAGRKHAQQAGQTIKKLIGKAPVYGYVSPWIRTRETFQQIEQQLGAQLVQHVEDPRLREQEWGHLRRLVDNQAIKQERVNYGTFYYRIPDGESGADVYDRVSGFLETLHRDFSKHDFPENALLVTHGVTLRIFLMRWFHWTPEYYESLRNPKNGQVVVMEQDPHGHYQLITPLAIR